MREAIDYNALNWVRKELGETLRQARLELESYADGDTRNELLQRCAAQLHQARGPLRMVSLKGADLLASEMEEAIADLLLGTIADPQTLMEFLMQGFIELPEYLFSLRSGRSDAPSAMFPVINSLRASRGLEPLRAEEVFTPNLAVRVPASVFDVRAAHDSHDQATSARTARVRFQSGLLEWYRGGADNQGITELLEVLVHLQQTACSEPAARLWWAGAGVAELLRDGQLQESAVLKRLFGQLDRSIKRLMDHGEAVFSDLLTDDLLKNLLFQITQVSSGSERIRLIRQTYQLSEPAVADDAAGQLSEELLQTVSQTAREDINRIKDQLDACQTGVVTGTDVMVQVADELHALGNMLGMIGMEQLGDTVAGQEQQLRTALLDGVDTECLDYAGMANTVLAVEDALVDISSQLGQSAGDDPAALMFRLGQEAVVEAIMTDMSAAKDSINEFLRSDGDFDLLGNVPVLLHKICGGLTLAGEERLAGAAAQVKRFITRELLAEHRALNESELDTLADAICSVEYCVEQLAANQQFGDRAIVVAEESLARLGYPVADVSGEGQALHGGDADVITFPHEVAHHAWNATATESVPDEQPFPDMVPAIGQAQEDVPPAQRAAAAADNSAARIHDLAVVGADADPEIVEIFIEEASEVIGELATAVPAWCENPVDADLLATIRRGFHTIKGSGRMVGALAAGEFAWAFEQLLNRVIDQSVAVSGPLLDLLGKSVEALYQLLAQVSDASRSPDVDTDALARQAVAMASGSANVLSELPVTEQPVTEADADAAPTVTTAAMEQDAGVPVVHTADLPVLTPDADPEIVEIFLEEATEELLNLRIAISSWIAQPQDRDLLKEVRRSFHTLKGSGRMAGALQLGEFAWLVEVMLNRVLEGVLEPVSAMCMFVTRVPEALQGMLAQIRDGVPPAQDIDALMAQAAVLASGQQAQAAGATEIQPDMAEDETDTTLMELFSVECGEHLATLANCVAEADDSCAVSDQLFRALHTLTGICESAQVPGIGALCEPLYAYFGHLHQEQLPAVPAAFAVLDDCLHEMQRQYAQLPVQSFDEWTLAQLQNRIQVIAGITEQARADAEVVAEAQVTPVAEEAMPLAAEIEPGAAECAVESVPEATIEPAVERTPEVMEEPSDETLAEALQVVLPVEAEATVPDSPWADTEDDFATDAYAAMDPELYQIFVEESSEIMEAGEPLLRAWADAPDNHELLTEFQRMLHTLKGGARMVEIAPIGDLSHAVESLLAMVADGALATTPELFVLLNEAFDRLADMVDRVRAHALAEPATGLEQRVLKFMQGDLSAPAPEVAGAEVAPQVSADETDEVVTASVEPGCDTQGEADAMPDAAESASPDQEHPEIPRVLAASPEFPAFAELTATAVFGVAPQPTHEPAGGNRGEQVRVHSDMLDSLVSNAGEMSIYRSRMEQQVSNYRFNLGELDATITRLRDQLRKLEMETEAQILYRFEQESDGRNEDFDPLEMDRYSNLQQLSRSLIESISDLQSLKDIMEQTTRDAETLLLQQSRVNTDLQECLIRTRMVPFAGLAPRLRRIVRQTARDLNKKVELELRGADGEMDRSVADRIIAPLEHMLRNAIAHGIEFPDQRTRNGKAAEGVIHIDFDRDGPEIVLRIADDGAGMNLPLIRQRAVERGLMAADAGLSDHEVMQFILATGFSTASEVTQISGRGVGMDVVNSEVKQLGGSLHIESETGKGTTFVVRLPYTLAINQALLVTAGEEPFFVPLASIEGVVRVFPDELLACYRKPDQLFEYGGSNYRLKHLGTLLGTGGMDLQHNRQQVPVLLLRIGDQRIGMQVESLLGNREVVIKPLGAQFSSVEGISGATILGDGRVVLILDMVAISRMNNRSHPGEVSIKPPQDGRLMVMVVDDSITVRKVTTRLLERNGYQVLTAKDGVDAMGQLQETLPDMLLLDIEMPRMDGFELATHMRNDERLRHVPIIMITSRTGDKHRERAREIGVNEYLGKPYQESELLDSIQTIIGINTATAAG